MNVDPRRLRVLLAVVRSAGVIGASRMLHLTPQAVSQQLSLLEAELGVPLFDRANRRLVPTEIGLSLAAHAERIEAELVAAGRTVSAATGRTLGVVRIAAFQSAIRWLVVEALPILRAEQPGVIPMIIELTGAAIENALRAGEVDLVIDERDDDQPDPSTRATAVQLIRRDPYCVVAPSPLARTLRRLRDLHSARWITGPKTGACHAALERLARRAKLTPQLAHVCLELPSVLALVAAGEGLAILPELALHDARAVEPCAISGLGARRRLAIQRTSQRGATEPAVDAVVRALCQRRIGDGLHTSTR